MYHLSSIISHLSSIIYNISKLPSSFAIINLAYLLLSSLATIICYHISNYNWQSLIAIMIRHTEGLLMAKRNFLYSIHYLQLIICYLCLPSLCAIIICYKGSFLRAKRNFEKLILVREPGWGNQGEGPGGTRLAGSHSPTFRHWVRTLDPPSL